MGCVSSTMVYVAVLPSGTVSIVGETVTPGGSGSATVILVSPTTGVVTMGKINMIPVIS